MPKSKMGDQCFDFWRREVVPLIRKQNVNQMAIKEPEQVKDAISNSRQLSLIPRQPYLQG